MRAYVLVRYGKYHDVVRLVDVAEDVVGAGEVLIDIKAAALNPIDLKIIAGDLRRIERYRLPRRIGFDGSGVVRRVGANVSTFKPGDAIYFRASRATIGTFAQSISLDARFVALKPQRLSFAEAASIPLVGLTTMQGLSDRARAVAGQRILIHAGAGGVGSFAIQYAKAIGLHVTTTTSTRNEAFVRALGADEIITYDTQDYRARSADYDIVFDTLGGDHTLDAFKVAKLGGAVISIVGPPDRQFVEQVGANFVARTVMAFLARKVFSASRATGVAYHRFLTESDGAQLQQLNVMLDDGRVKPIVERIFPFDELLRAFDQLATGRTRGKIVLATA